MKDSKYCKVTSCCWDHRHELVGLILLIIASFLTIVTCNGLGIIGMFLVGLVLCCHKHFCCPMHHHHHDHCHTDEECCDAMHEEHTDKSQVKKSSAKAKK